MLLSGRVAIIAGVGGLGSAVARAFAREGAAVVLGDSGDAALAYARAAVADHGGVVRTVRTESTSADGDRLVRAALDAFDRVDVVICNEVLHHTQDARAGFVALLRKVRPGGLILMGLYNTYARLPTLWRRWAFERFGPNLYFLDRRLTAARLSEGRWRAWFRHQYCHPHETRHSIDEVLGWFDASGVDFLSSVPAADGSPFTSATRLFEPHSRGTMTLRAAAQLEMLLTGGRDGGLFVMIGRKRA